MWSMCRCNSHTLDIVVDIVFSIAYRDYLMKVNYIADN